MIFVNVLIWDNWNRQHLAKHNITPEEVEQVCHGQHHAVESYRGRIQLTGITKNERKLIIILSPEDRKLKRYQTGVYYPVTAFEEVE